MVLLLPFTSRDRDLSLLIEFGDVCGVGPRGDRERRLGVAGGVASGDLSFMCLSLGSPLLSRTIGGAGAGSCGIGLFGSP